MRFDAAHGKSVVSFLPCEVGKAGAQGGHREEHWVVLPREEKRADEERRAHREKPRVPSTEWRLGEVRQCQRLDAGTSKYQNTMPMNAVPPIRPNSAKYLHERVVGDISDDIR